jgi:oxalate---CoA ligase
LPTIWEVLAEGARRDPRATALLAPGGLAIGYARLHEISGRVARALRSRGIGHRDVVAIVLPNGPEMALAFLAAASCSAAAPLNPSYTAADFRFYLDDLGAKAVIVGEGSPAAIREVAGDMAWEWTSLLEADVAHGDVDAPEDSATALLLHTSGTTSRPKLVPLTHRNLLVSAGNIARTLHLTPEDRCLNIMPLFHIHGLAAALLASLHAGASVVCSDGVFARGFFAWLEEFHPSWYSAVPTMHQGILARAESHSAIVRRSRLRFIRSSSAALSPQVMAELERVFRAPVVEAYGMTEAAHQMCCNPLPPKLRKPGSVGLAAGPEVAVMDGAGNLLGVDVPGEVVIRGENVTPGYVTQGDVANEAANAGAFAHGWFHTGDQGRLDADGYLHLTGRLKELINRGGEKFSPRETNPL